MCFNFDAAMLHTVNKSFTNGSGLASCLRLAARGSDILLIEDGVYASLAGAEQESIVRDAAARFSIYVLKNDLECRGFVEDDVIAGIKLIDYDGFVQLAVQNSAVHSWL